MFIRRIVIRLFLPMVWRTSKQRMADGLQRFAVTENDSVWQILRLIKVVDSPALRAKVFQHALEEAHHAAEFDRVSRLVSPRLPHRPVQERTAIFQPNLTHPVMNFMAYAHVGEDDVLHQFDAYAAAVNTDEIRSVFQEAKVDERGHAGLTKQLCHRAAPNLRAARMAVARVRFRRAYDSWLRVSKHVGDLSSGILLGAMYLSLGMLAVLGTRIQSATSPMSIGGDFQ